MTEKDKAIEEYVTQRLAQMFYEGAVEFECSPVEVPIEMTNQVYVATKILTDVMKQYLEHAK